MFCILNPAVILACSVCLGPYCGIMTNSHPKVTVIETMKTGYFISVENMNCNNNKLEIRKEYLDKNDCSENEDVIFCKLNMLNSDYCKDIK